MAAQPSVFNDSFLVLFSSTHVMFLDMNEQRRAETFMKRNQYFRNGSIEPIKILPSGVQLGRVYRHYSPADKNIYSD